MKLMVHFLLSNLKNQIQGNINKRYPKNNYGKVKAVSYLGEGDRIIQRTEFEHYKGDAVLDDEDKKLFTRIPGLDLNKELKSCKSIIAKFDFEKNKIAVVYYYNDGTTKTINF